MLSHPNSSERDVMGELQWEACMNNSLEGWDGSVEVLLCRFSFPFCRSEEAVLACGGRSSPLQVS